MLQHAQLHRPASPQFKSRPVPATQQSVSLHRRFKLRTRYQPDDATPTGSPVEVTAEDTYRAAASNMHVGAWGGRWERWAPPAVGKEGGISRADDVSSGWQLLTSGQSGYVFKPSGPLSMSVFVMEAPDTTTTSMAQAAAQLVTMAALGTDSEAAGPTAAQAGAFNSSGLSRVENKFAQDDHFFRPYLPDLTQPGGDMGLRLWAADGLGFVMATTALPQAMLHTKPTQRPAEATQTPPPFIANLYIQHPSLEPGVGRRWGWNVQYGAAADPAAAQQHQAGPLQHIHHTSLGRLALGDHDGGEGGGVEAQALLQPGLHTRPPTAPRDASLTSDVAGFARWLLTYRAGDGQLETVRMEVYKPGSD